MRVVVAGYVTTNPVAVIGEEARSRVFWQAGVELGIDPGASRAGRDLLWDQVGPLLSSAHRSELLDDATLIVSEMITNAIQASASRVRLDIELHRDHIVLGVLDDAAGWPTPRRAPPTATNGRGLAIIEALSGQWGVTAEAPGKRVWARMPIAPDRTTDANS